MRAPHDPSWWNEGHSSAWERAKEAMRRTPSERVKHAVRRGWDSAKSPTPVARR